MLDVVAENISGGTWKSINMSWIFFLIVINDFGSISVSDAKFYLLNFKSKYNIWLSNPERLICQALGIPVHRLVQAADSVSVWLPHLGILSSLYYSSFQ
jgi:hypothetical protein